MCLRSRAAQQSSLFVTLITQTTFVTNPLQYFKNCTWKSPYPITSRAHFEVKDSEVKQFPVSANQFERPIQWVYFDKKQIRFHSLTTVAKGSFTYPHSSLGDKQYCCPVLCSSSTRTDICCRMLFRYWYTLDLDRKGSFRNTHSELQLHWTFYKLQMMDNTR